MRRVLRYLWWTMAVSSPLQKIFSNGQAASRCTSFDNLTREFPLPEIAESWRRPNQCSYSSTPTAGSAKNCLATLTSTIARSPQHDCFQLRLTGSGSTVVGRAEELRLATFQEHALQPDGRIRYLNTAGFAIRRARAQNRDGLFDPVAQRGEDTLLLANLMKRDELPLFVADAVVEHSISLSLIGCLGKDIRSAYLECKTYEMIDSKGVEIRITNRERLQLLGSMWKAASQPSIGRVAWVVVVGRQALQRIISLGYRWLRIGAIRSTRNVNRQR